MSLSIISRLVLISILIVGIICSNSKRVIERIKYLENRINTESQFRNEEYTDVIDRLDAIDKQLNVFTERRVGFNNSDQQSSDANTENVDQLRDDFTRIQKAFREEKSETARVRRELPIIENDLTAVKQDLEYYCAKNLNKTDELISRVEESDDVFKTDMKSALKNTSQKFKATVEQIVEESIQKTVKELQVMENNKKQDIALTKEKIENIEIIVSQLSARLEHLFEYNSCSEYKKAGMLLSGVYTLRQGVQVYCDQTTDGGGWLVFQRRQNGEVDFYRNWAEYKNGFGDLNGEFWLGNEHLSSLTAVGSHELRIDMEDFDGNNAYAKYSKFQIYSEEEHYKLEISGVSGNAGDSLGHHNGMAFSTFDNDNDKWSGYCAKDRHGAWWYTHCAVSNLNGQYYNKPGKIDSTGINWYHWKHKYYSLKYVEMKFR